MAQVTKEEFDFAWEQWRSLWKEIDSLVEEIVSGWSPWMSTTKLQSRLHKMLEAHDPFLTTLEKDKAEKLQRLGEFLEEWQETHGPFDPEELERVRKGWDLA